HNRGRLGKTLWTQAETGDKLIVRGLWDAEQEARWAGDEIEALQRRGHKLREIALLVRAGFQTREFEERFIALALPYRVIGAPRSTVGATPPSGSRTPTCCRSCSTRAAIPGCGRPTPRPTRRAASKT